MPQAHARVQWGPDRLKDRVTVFGYGRTEAQAILDSYRAQNALAVRMGKNPDDMIRQRTEVK